MEAISNGASAFIGLFESCAEIFVDNLVGLIPLVLIMLTVFNAVIGFVGEERVNRFSSFLGRYKITAYLILPIVGWLLLANPMAFSLSKFLPPRMKAGYFEAACPQSAWLMCFFPHVNPAEYFIWWGIASGVSEAGFNVFNLGFRLGACLVLVSFFRALVAEFLFKTLAKRDGHMDLVEADHNV